MKIIIKIKNKRLLKECQQIGCKNIALCEDGCIGFVARNEKLKWEYEHEQLGNNACGLNNCVDEDCELDRGCDLYHYNRERIDR